MHESITKLYRTEKIEGCAIPALIRDGSHTFIDLEVFADGYIQSVIFEDFESFKEGIESNHIAMNIPDNNEIVIKGLGNWIIDEGLWTYDKITFANYIEERIKELNPEFKSEKSEKESEQESNIWILQHKVRKAENVTIYRDKSCYLDGTVNERLEGNSTNLFYRQNGTYYLVKVNVFTNYSIQLSRLESTVELSLEKFEEYVMLGTILSEVPLHEPVVIYGLGTFIMKEVRFVKPMQQMMLHINDMFRELNALPTSTMICFEAYIRYKAYPTEDNKKELKRCYENIPDYKKIRVGESPEEILEMRMIIYGESAFESDAFNQKIKNWGKPLFNPDFITWDNPFRDGYYKDDVDEDPDSFPF
jgi:hypothetical protein